MMNKFLPYRLIGILILIGLLTTACDQPLFLNDLEVIKARGELIVITRNSTTCYYEGPQGPTGFEYELVKAFADHLEVSVRPLIIEDEADMIEALRGGKADIIAAGIPFGNQSARLVALGPGYLTVKQQVVGRRGSITPNDISDLSGSAIWMTGSSVRTETLNAIKASYAEVPWKTLSDFSSEELLQMVWNRSLPLTMVESHTLAMNRRYYPELVVHFTLGTPRKLAWAMHPQSRHLQKEVTKWFAATESRKYIQGLIDYYFSHLEDFDYVDLVRFRRRIQARLPKYQSWFEEAATKYGMDWQLVAAQAYQESHWNPRAKSFTGVRGIMMLTQDTARSMGLTNRLEAKESIFAGTRYMARLHRMVGDEVQEPDRTLMALAAYNIGLGHLQDARVLAERLGKPSNTWHGVRSVFPLLQKKKYYRTLRHGYARGNEAVQYVDRIRTYHKVLIMAMLPHSLYGMGGVGG
ncbi:MAG: membrane-bound lytic murein transglycosylase MltF [Desulfobacteraceae bacterium]|jgi:membrane-bound lytic murein transglycosylase F